MAKITLPFVFVKTLDTLHDKYHDGLVDWLVAKGYISEGVGELFKSGEVGVNERYMEGVSGATEESLTAPIHLLEDEDNAPTHRDEELPLPDPFETGY